MAGTIIFTGANSSLGLHATQHFLSAYPEHTFFFTVRDDSDADTNTAKLRQVIARFPNAKPSIRALDLASLPAVHAFANTIIADITTGKLPPLAAIVANAYYWNLVGDPEITADGFDKTIQVAHIAHAALILRLVGSFGDSGRIVLLSSDAHWPGKNPNEKYPPAIPENLDDLIQPASYADKQGRGFQRYAQAKLAITTWLYPLNRYLQKEPSLAKISAVAINPGNLVDSRALTTNTPVSMHRLQKFLLKPLLPLFQIPLGPTLRTAGPAGIDVVELTADPKYANKRGFYTLLNEDKSSPDSQDQVNQAKIWKQTLQWAGITQENTTLKAGF